MPERPQPSPHDPATPQPKQAAPISSGREAYNIVTDLAGGPNVRRSDNKYQAMFVAVVVVVAAAIGAIVAVMKPKWDLPWYGGAMIGSFAGLVVGIFSSGIFLMFFRATRHFKGRHD